MTNLDSPSSVCKDPSKALAQHERAKKRKYLQRCLNSRCHFTPFVVSVDGLVGTEAKKLLQNLANRLAAKWSRSYSEVAGYVYARMSIAIVRATHLTLRGSRVPAAQISYQRPLWEDGAGLGLLHYS